MISKCLSKCLVKVLSRKSWGSSLVGQCLRLHASTARSDSLIPGRGTKIRTSEKKKKKKRKSWDLSCRSIPFLFLCIGFQCLPFRSVCMPASLKVRFSFDFQEASTHQKRHNVSDFRKQFPAPISKTFWADLTHCEFMGNTNTAFHCLFPMEFCSELYYVRIFNEKCILLLWCIEIHGFLSRWNHQCPPQVLPRALWDWDLWNYT